MEREDRARILAVQRVYGVAYGSIGTDPDPHESEVVRDAFRQRDTPLHLDNANTNGHSFD